MNQTRTTRIAPTFLAFFIALSAPAAGCAGSDPPYDQTGQKSKEGSTSGEGGSAGGTASGASGNGAGSATGGGNTGAGTGGTDAPMGGAATSYNVDVSQTSVSGLSAGGFMAVQFHVAFSSIMKGVAVFAGGPYGCAQGQLNQALTQCMYPTIPPSVAPFVAMTNQNAAGGGVDDPKGLAAQKVFLFGGADDHTVNPVVMDSLNSYYAAFMGAANIHYENRHPGAGHVMPTTDYGGSCDITAEPWIANCNYDGAGLALAHIYGTLAPKATSLSGEIVTLAQANFLPSPASHSVADTGYVYVPAACKNGESCRVHVAFHGCEQEATGSVGDKFYKNAGYNAWADTNHIIVLYPQTIVGMGTESNPQACWDWWGYDSPDYTKKSGPQMNMVRKMIDFLAGK